MVEYSGIKIIEMYQVFVLYSYSAEY